MSDFDVESESDTRRLAVDRQQRLRAAMRRADTPALLIVDSINILYATGASNMTIFSTRTPARYLLLLADGPAILYEYFGCEHLAAGLATIDEVRPARGLCFVSSGGDPVAQGQGLADDVAAVLADLGVARGRLAIDRFPFAAVDALRGKGFHLTDADPIVSEARKIKLPGEIEMLREALRRVAAAAAEMEAGIEPGRSECELWADFQRRFVATEGQYVSTRLLQSGERTYPYFQEAGSRRLRAGELVCFDTDTIGFGGYCTDFSRTYLCGDAATPAQRDLYRKAKEQLEHNVALIVPGAAYEAIAAAAWPVPAEHRDSRYYCIGHGLGMSGEFPNIPHRLDGEPYPLDGALEPGMVICIESYVGSQATGEGVKLEEQLLVTETSTERMSASVPFDARLLPVEY